MKKWVFGVLVACAMFALVACGDSAKKDSELSESTTSASKEAEMSESASVDSQSLDSENTKRQAIDSEKSENIEITEFKDRDAESLESQNDNKLDTNDQSSNNSTENNSDEAQGGKEYFYVGADYIDFDEQKHEHDEDCGCDVEEEDPVEQYGKPVKNATAKTKAKIITQDDIICQRHKDLCGRVLSYTMYVPEVADESNGVYLADTSKFDLNNPPSPTLEKHSVTFGSSYGAEELENEKFKKIYIEVYNNPVMEKISTYKYKDAKELLLKDAESQKLFKKLLTDFVRLVYETNEISMNDKCSNSVKYKLKYLARVNDELVKDFMLDLIDNKRLWEIRERCQAYWAELDENQGFMEYVLYAVQNGKLNEELWDAIYDDTQNYNYSSIEIYDKYKRIFYDVGEIYDAVKYSNHPNEERYAAIYKIVSAIYNEREATEMTAPCKYIFYTNKQQEAKDCEWENKHLTHIAFSKEVYDIHGFIMYNTYMTGKFKVNEPMILEGTITKDTECAKCKPRLILKTQNINGKKYIPQSLEKVYLKADGLEGIDEVLKAKKVQLKPYMIERSYGKTYAYYESIKTIADSK